jgi:hypothetical protein
MAEINDDHHQKTMDLLKELMDRPFEVKRREKFPRFGYIYIMEDEWCKYVKIGFAYDPEERLKSIQPCFPHRLYLKFWFRGTEKEERAIHRKLAEWRMRGEWFDGQLDGFWPALRDALPAQATDHEWWRDRIRE